MMHWNQIAVLLLSCALLVGCKGKSVPVPQQSEAEPTSVTLPVDSQPSGSDDAVRYGVFSLDGGESTEENGNYDSSESDENALLACDGAVLTVQNADVNKTGDGTRTLASGLNAAAAAVRGAKLTLNNCVITTHALAAPGLFASGTDSALTLDGTQAVTVGSGSPVAVCSGGATLALTNARLTAESADSPLLSVFGGGTVTISHCTLRSANTTAVELTGGTLTLTLSAQELTGDMRLLGEEGEETPAQLLLHLTDGASYTGGFVSDSEHTVSVWLDAASSWTLTGDVTVAAITAPDALFSNIHSAGHSIFYNAELEANAWLNSLSYKLPDGGYLSPLI